MFKRYQEQFVASTSMFAMIQCLAAKPKVSALMLKSFIIVRKLSFEWLSIQTWSFNNRKHGWCCSSFSMCSSSLTHSGKCKDWSLVCSTFIRHADYPCNLLYFTFCVVHLPGTNIIPNSIKCLSMTSFVRSFANKCPQDSGLSPPCFAHGVPCRVASCIQRCWTFDVPRFACNHWRYAKAIAAVASLNTVPCRLTLKS